MYCEQCGYGFSARARYCRLCGAALEEDKSLGSYLQPRYTRAAIWNPSVAVYWSFFLSPIFGSYIQMRNWIALGEPEQATAARTWLFLSLGSLALQFTAPLIGQNFFTLLAILFPLIFFPVWYFAFARKQRQYVQESFPFGYKRKPWGKILTLSIIGFALYIFAAMAIYGFYSLNVRRVPPAHPDSNVETLGDFAALVPDNGNAVTAPKNKSNEKNAPMAANPTASVQPVQVTAAEYQRSDAQVDYINQEFRFGFRYPSSWLTSQPNTPNSRAHVVSPAGTPAAECAVIVQRYPEADAVDQESINSIFREQPNPFELKAALSQTYSNVEIFDARVSALGPLPAHDVRSTYSFVSGSSLVYQSGRTVTTASPGYTWTVTCGGLGKTAAEADKAFLYWESKMDRLIQSFKFF